ncbi:MAG: AraC family transcriptional regulator [Planctomycetota bacterium]|jgi:LacI family transcriptional regulator
MPGSRKVILLVESSRGFGRDLLQGIADYVRFHGPWTFYHPPFFYMRSSRKSDEELPRLKSWGADGIIARELSRKTREQVLSLGIPAVFHPVLDEKPMHGVGNICGDDVAIGELAAEHLLSLGFRNFAFCGLNDFFWSKRRAGGFREALSRRGFEPSVYQYPRSRQERLWANEQKLLTAWLKSLPKPVGLMACIDERAQEVIEACKQARLRIPEEVAVIGADDDKLICELSNPPLSSIALSSIRAGYEAAELLDELMSDRRPKDSTVYVRPLHVVSRQSTDVQAVTDQEVAAAMNFIKNNITRPIQVSDVVSHCSLSRNILARRFKKALGRTMQQEIKSLRIERIAGLLVSTSMPVSHIASTVGFSDANHFSRYFRKERKMTPLAYRRKYGPLDQST